MLSDAETREFLVSQPIPDYLDRLTDTELLSRLWRARIDLTNPASVNAFVGTLSPPEQDLVHRLLAEETARITPQLAQECLQALKRQSIQNEIAVSKAQLGTPNLPPDQVEQLTKQLLDLRKQLHDV